MSFELMDNMTVDRDEAGQVHHLEHLQYPYRADTQALAVPTPQALVAQYLNEPEVKKAYGLPDAMVNDLTGADFQPAEGMALTGQDQSRLNLAAEKSLLETTTVSYVQTYRGLPIWEAGVSATVLDNPRRVTSSQSSVHHNITLAPQGNLERALYGPDSIRSNPSELKRLLGVGADPSLSLTINGTRALIYQFRAAERGGGQPTTPPSGFEAPPPTLPLPPIPATIVEGAHYVVTEVLFSAPAEGWGDVNWRTFLEPVTGTVLYLRALTAAVDGAVFQRDPITTTGNAVLTPTAGNAALNPLRATESLLGLVPPANGTQALTGAFVRLQDVGAPVVLPPTQPVGGNFIYQTSTDDFSAVNAYRHCDWLFRLVQGLGFNIPTFFDGTSFPVRVDHRALGGVTVNAQAPANVTGSGSDGFRFVLAEVPGPGRTTVGIAADVRVVLHEFAHALLEDSVHSPNFGFAHSCGDSLASILLDPDSALRGGANRGLTFPWPRIGGAPLDRRHDRPVAAGWGWGGVNDTGISPFNPGYESEQVLSSTMFRFYQSLGGDALDLNRCRLAARLSVYLIVRAVGSLATGPVTPTPTPNVFATALMNADIGTTDFEGQRGGALHKILRWSFEKQGLYQPAGAPRPVTQPGAPPAVDVYIDDGRNGEYQWLENFWSTTDIWNRLAADGGLIHQTPVVGQSNYAYVRVKNRGSAQANNVVVRGYHCRPGVGLVWPGDWQPMATPQVAIPAGIAPGGAVVVGPFEWTPSQVGHECMFMSVSASGDLSNIDPASATPCASGPMAEWRLVPFDNNIAQRNVAPVAGGGGIRGLIASFIGRQFTVKNPLDKRSKLELRAVLPQFLTERGWQVSFERTGAVLSLAPGEQREIAINLRSGGAFNTQDVRAQHKPTIEIHVVADGIVIGGMTYVLDPQLQQPPLEQRGRRPIGLRDRAVEAALLDTGIGDAVAEGNEGTASSMGTSDEAVRTSAEALLSHLNVPGPNVRGVRVRRISLDIDLAD